ncbi:Qat anti-phage system QueC-like protein QatC [Sulfuricurvum sp.]|uniref:Qat anti-phage system QueC-like protein QatC n=1 Tax=Sulfuricurvum sp. TaxID=2025608 RepID=UPI0026339443|nr:Qat anti-phage system QueC-like protein QatC [Sulfuricurvum sp.]MDD3597067.1 hypothetical protein [Sulfuricurvum sp.]
MNDIVISPHDRDSHGLLLMDITVAGTDIATTMHINPKRCFEKYISRPNELSLDLLYFTSYIYAIDKLLLRKNAIDAWSRDINVAIPVYQIDRWLSSVEVLQDALNFLTGDNWNLTFVQLESPYFQKDTLDIDDSPVFEHVCLFSGGLDSFVGAIDLIDKYDNVLLVSHFDGTGATQPMQDALFHQIQSKYPKKHIANSQFHVVQDCGAEDSTRGRSILFLGLALYHALNLNISRVITPENGLISINLPLTPSRTCSNSTKTMHPYFVHQFQTVLAILGINIVLTNPYLKMTKGEMLQKCNNPELLRDGVRTTLSCSHSGHTSSWVRRNTHNCGYCIPCLIRRASVHAFDSVLDSGEDYGNDLIAEEIGLHYDSQKRKDILALSWFVSKKYSLVDLVREIKLMAPTDDADEIAYMLQRGYHELKELINAKADDDIKRLFS